MTVTSASGSLIGRAQELALVQEWAGGVAQGPSALVVRGEPGIGKSTVWREAAEAARREGALVLRARPVEAELPLGYAALADLLAAHVEPVLGELVDPASRALRRALMLSDERGPIDPHGVARGALLALRELAIRVPVVIAVDDVHWLDPASARALAFVARRLESAPISLAISIRDNHDDPLALHDITAPLHELRLGGLDAEATASLLRARVDRELSRRDTTRIHVRSGGNPFFALELAHTAALGETPGTLLQLVEQRLALVTPEAAAAIDLAAVLGRSPVRSFTDVSALDEAIRSGILVELDGEIRFAHPLLATGAYERLQPGRRRALHLVGAELADDLEARARHLALATIGPDAEIAAQLDEAAAAAAERGAPEAAAELASHGRRLTPRESEEYVRRAMDEADYLFLAADEPAARALVDVVLASDVDGALRARALVQKGLHETDPTSAVARLEEAVTVAHDDEVLAARAQAQLTWQCGAWLGDVERASREGVVAVELAERHGDEQLLLAALTAAGHVAALAGEAHGEAYLERAVRIADRNPTAVGDHTPRLALAHWRWWSCRWSDAEALLAAERAYAEERGDESLLLRIDVLSTDVDLRRGRWDEAAGRLDELLEDARDYWRVLVLSRRAVLRGRRGELGALEDVRAIAESPIGSGDPVFAATIDFVSGLLELADGRIEHAAERLLVLPTVAAGSGARAPDFAATIPEVVTALGEAGRHEEAEQVLGQLTRWSPQLDPWAAAAAKLCRGQLMLSRSDTNRALAALAAAREEFTAMDAPWELGQALLGEGRALRRLGRRRDAARSLELAVEVLGRLGAAPMRSSAIDELRRARPRPRSDDSLTEAERRVALLVAEGHTNKEVAARLFLTVRTVEAHLTRIYGKLGLRSRSELARAVADRRIELSA